jgi:hypothetical protein
MRIRPWLTFTFLAGSVALVPAQQQKAPALPDILASAATYLVDYSQRIGAVEAEEALIQRETTGGGFGPGHTWKAEIVLLGYGNGDFSTFRDIFELEEKKARQRDSRVFHLFRTNPENAVVQGQSLTNDAARSGMGAGMAAFNTPTLPLAFLRKENQSRSTFKLENVRNMNGAQVAIVRFTETAKPRLVPGTDKGTTQGRFWIEVASGTVRQTEILYTDSGVDVKATAMYALEPKLQLWLPTGLDSRYDMTSGGMGGATNMGKATDARQVGTHQTIDASAKFTKYQQTAVDLTKLAK